MENNFIILKNEVINLLKAEDGMCLIEEEEQENRKLIGNGFFLEIDDKPFLLANVY